jgi:RES domain-containing protein
MRLWRMTDTRYAGTAFSGQGASIVGGRWNVKGHRVVYCASSRSNAALEVSVAFGETFQNAILDLRRRFVLIPIDVPDEVSRETIRLSEMPPDWVDSIEITQRMGEEWLIAGRTCLLRIPSVLIPGEANYLINPFHTDFELVLVRPVQAYGAFDEFVEGEHDFEQAPTKRRVEASGPRDLFLCHSPNDLVEVVDPLRLALMDFGISCWVRSAEITVGDSIIQKVDDGLTRSKYVLLIISPSFLMDQEATLQTRAALYRETKERRKVVLPIVVNYPGQTVNLAAALPLAPDKDFYVWQGDAYAAAKEILRSIRAQ